MKTTPRHPSLLSLACALAVLAVLAVLVLLGILPTTAEAQLPRPQKAPYNTAQLQRYTTTAAFPWTLTVCKGTPYGGDFADLSEALATIPARFPVRGPMQRVLVLVYPCFPPSPTSFTYEETNLSVPSWTTVHGVPTGVSGNTDAQAARVFLKLTGTTTTCEGCPSALLKLETGASLTNFYIQSSTPPTGPIRLVETNGAVTLTNVVLQLTGVETNPVDLLYVATGTFLGHNLGLTRNTFSSLSRGLVVTGASNAVLTGGRIFVPSGVPVENAGTGSVKLYGVRIDPSSVVDIKRSSTGTIETFSTDYATETGGIIDRPIRADSITIDNACRLLTGTGSPEGVVAAPVCSLFLRQDGTATTTLYVKTTGGTTNTGWTAK